MGLKWTLLLFVGVLLSCGSCQNWMGAGNFTYDNLTVIINKINSFDRKASLITYSTPAATLSTELNDLWAPAWNVVVVYYYDGANYDAVLYGYAFRGHWFWFNGFKVSLGYISFIIWKDYNCAGWVTLNALDSDFKQSSFGDPDTTALTNTIKNGYAGRDLEDIWLTAQDIQAKVPTANTATFFQDKLAFSVIVAPSVNSYFFGQLCVKYYLILGNVGTSDGNSDGKALILQMRS